MGWARLLDDGTYLCSISTMYRLLRETIDGNELAYETIRRLCCDANVRTIRLDADGKPINVGRQHRTATTHQWAALKAIYSSCAWAHCERPVSWCQGIRLRRNSSCSLRSQHRPSKHDAADNLVPLCNKHHHAVHEGQWTIKLLPDRTLRIFQPNGQHHATACPDRLNNRDSNGEPPGDREPNHI